MAGEPPSFDLLCVPNLFFKRSANVENCIFRNSGTGCQVYAFANFVEISDCIFDNMSDVSVHLHGAIGENEHTRKATETKHKNVMDSADESSQLRRRVAIDAEKKAQKKEVLYGRISRCTFVNMGSLTNHCVLCQSGAQCEVIFVAW